jgi:hypothetical protein
MQHQTHQPTAQSLIAGVSPSTLHHSHLHKLSDSHRHLGSRAVHQVKPNPNAALNLICCCPREGVNQCMETNDEGKLSSLEATFDLCTRLDHDISK